jgi:hypothetical protein
MRLGTDLFHGKHVNYALIYMCPIKV